VKRLVLLRHGQTAWNAERRGQGHLDVPLDEIGLLQAKAVAPWMASYRPVRLVSSDLARAAQTTVLIAETTGLTPTYDARLREYDLGDRTGLTLTEYAQRFPAEYDAYREGRFEAVSGGEDTAQLLTRLRPAIDEVADSLADDETAVVVSHGAALKVALLDLLGFPDGLDRTLKGLDNCGWVVVVADRVQPDGNPSWRLAGYNLSAQDPDFASDPGVG
jgi:broad specificity phosphatase PhoE